MALGAAAFLSASAFAEDPLPAADRMKSCDPKIALAAAKEVLGDPKTLKEPLEMFVPSAVLFWNGEKDEAVFWFYAAQLRARYQLAFEKGDRGQLLLIMIMSVGAPINNYAFQDVGRLDRTLERVLAWDKTAPNPYRERSRTSEAEAAIEKVYAGLRDLRAKIAAEKADIEQQARAAAPEMEQMLAASRTPPCKPGEPDPAYANRILEREKRAVEEFARGHRDVARAAGTVKSVSVAASRVGVGASVTGRYTVSVVGSAKTVYAEVDVTRSGGTATFSLACVTDLWIGQREAFKDVCGK